MHEKLSHLLSDPAAIKIAVILIGFSIIWLIIKIIQGRLLSKIKDNDSRYRAGKFGSFLGYFFTILLVVFVFSDKLQGLTVALGVAGAGIAFALQEVIASFAGWLTILFGGFYKPGDRVQLGGIKGDVMDIGVLRTTIMETGQWVNGDLYNGRIVLIANSFVFKEPVFNYSGEFPFLWDEIKVGIQFGSNYEKASQIILNAGNDLALDIPHQSLENWKNLQRKYRLEDAQTEPMISMVMTDNWVEYTLRYVVDYKRRRVSKTALFKRILSDVENTKGEVKFASATFQLVDPPEIKVNIKQ